MASVLADGEGENSERVEEMRARESELEGAGRDCECEVVGDNCCEDGSVREVVAVAAEGKDDEISASGRLGRRCESIASEAAVMDVEDVVVVCSTR